MNTGLQHSSQHAPFVTCIGPLASVAHELRRLHLCQNDFLSSHCQSKKITKGLHHDTLPACTHGKTDLYSLRKQNSSHEILCKKNDGPHDTLLLPHALVHLSLLCKSFAGCTCARANLYTLCVQPCTEASYSSTVLRPILCVSSGPLSAIPSALPLGFHQSHHQLIRADEGVALDGRKVLQQRGHGRVLLRR